MVETAPKNNRTITVHFAGGLGNQLFQYAYFCYLKDLGLEVEAAFGTLPIRLTSQGRPWFESVTSNRVRSIKTNLWKKFIFRILIFLTNHLDNSIFSKFGCPQVPIRSFQRNYLLRTHVIREVGFCNQLENINEGNLFGYFQTDFWLKKIEISKHFEFVEIEHYFYQLAKVELPLVVHVRIGDYSDNPQLGILSKNYYHDGIRFSMKNANHRAIWLFSDSPEEAITRIPNEMRDLVRFMDDQLDSPLQTLEKMRLGTGYILANSSLSWWAAYLTYNSGANVVVPKPWFKQQVEPTQLIPSTWQIENADWGSPK